MHPPSQLNTDNPRFMNPFTRTEEDEEVQAAIESVYRKYGPDLSAFFRDVQAQLRQDQQAKKRS